MDNSCKICEHNKECKGIKEDCLKEKLYKDMVENIQMGKDSQAILREILDMASKTDCVKKLSD